MKQRIDSTVLRSLACSLAISGGGFLGCAALAADSPAPPPPLSSATNVLTLDGAIRLALENNPELRASSGRIDAATGRAVQAIRNDYETAQLEEQSFSQALNASRQA